MFYLYLQDSVFAHLSFESSNQWYNEVWL